MALWIPCISLAQNEYVCKDSEIDAVFYHPQKRPYKQIVSNLSKKYSREYFLSLEEIIQAYPVTTEEFDWFYKTYNPRSEYGDYQADTSTFFIYIDKNIRECASSGNLECLYRVFNLRRLTDIMRNTSLNENWVLDVGYYNLADIIENGNHRQVHYLFKQLDKKTLLSFTELNNHFPEIFQERKTMGSYIADGKSRQIEAYEDPLEKQIAVIICDIGQNSNNDKVQMHLDWLRILPFRASLEEALEKYREFCGLNGEGQQLIQSVIFPPEIVEWYSNIENKWHYSKPVLLKSRFEINSSGKVCFFLYGEAEFEHIAGKNQQISLRFNEENELLSLITVLDRDTLSRQ